MAASEKLRDRRSTWIFLAPISYLEMGEAVNFEQRVDQVTFVSAKHLPYRRKRFGFPHRISRLRETHQGTLQEWFFADTDTFATLRRTGTPNDFKNKVLRLVRDELAILSLSQLGMVGRRTKAAPTIADELPAGKRKYLAVDSKDSAWTGTFERVGTVRPLRLDALWKRWASDGFFFGLLKILREEVHVDKGWRDDIRNAAILGGQSQCSLDLPQAFLWNMIALELLLTNDGDSKRMLDTLPARAEAFLGWSGYWKVAGYEEKIRAAYKKRCRFVHQGDRDCIAPRDLRFTDDLLFNLFRNIVHHPDLLSSKRDIIRFSEKVQAERLLGIKPQVQPATFRLVQFTPSKRDMDRSIFR